jgi:argininosuccinate lyase
MPKELKLQYKLISIFSFYLLFIFFNHPFYICNRSSSIRSFRESYAIAAKLVNYAEKKNKLLFEISLQEIQKVYKNLDKKVFKIFDVNNSMNSKRSYGGTSIANVKRMIKIYKKEVK